jgi:hypothetical protein
VQDVELAPEPGGHPGRPPDQSVGPRSGADGDHDAFTGLPHGVRLVLPQMLQQFLVGLVGQEAQRQFPQRGQVVGAEELGQGQRDPFLRVDVAVQHAPAELLGRGVDQLDLVGLAHHPVRDAFTDPRPGHVLHLVGDALQVLDIDGGDDVDPGGEDLQHVLPAFLVLPGSGHVGVGELVDQGDLRVPAQDRVQVHLLQHAAPVLDLLAGHDLQVADHRLGPLAAVGFDEPDDHVGAPVPPAAALVEHGVGLADARGGAEVDAEVAGRLDHAVGAGAPHLAC